MIQRFTLQQTMSLFILSLTLNSFQAAAADDARHSLWERVKGAARVVAHEEVSPGNQHVCPPRQHGTHFGLPTRSYSAFESPTSYGSHPSERCRAEVFSPRGIGVARRSGCEWMDYSPYVLSTTESNHGPSYYTRHHLSPCTHPHCNH